METDELEALAPVSESPLATIGSSESHTGVIVVVSISDGAGC